MKNILVIVAIVLSLSSCGESSMWPDLEDISSTHGKPATAEDVNCGAAVFLLGAEFAETSMGKPMEIHIPQYAYHIDQETQQKTPVIIIQAEETANQQLVGAITLPEREYMAGLFYEFELLGIKKPE